MRYVNNMLVALFLLVMTFNLFPVTLDAQMPIHEKIPGTFSTPYQNQSATADPTLTTATGLQQFYSSTGRYTLSVDGIGSLNTSMNIRVNKPNAQATVQKAVLISSVTSRTITNGCVTIRGVPVNWDGSASVSFFNNYWADVTSIVSAQINSFPAGISTLPITECNTASIEGEALLVVFNDPSATEKTIIIMLGGQNPAGDNFSVTLAQPINPNQPGALLDMGLGIGFGFQLNGGSQASQVSVNNQRITSSAGGEDDGVSQDGGLITVGGIGDVNTNPANPLVGPSNPRTDDELYSILPFINSSTTSLNINTINPSLDDNIFLAYFALSGAAIIGEGILLSQTTSSGNVGEQHTVKASVLNTSGQPVANRLVTFSITSGPNAGGIFSTNTNASGEAFYTYTGSGGSGTDSIQAVFTNSQNQQSISNKLGFQWISGNNYYSKPIGDLHNVATWGTNMDGSGFNPPDFSVGKTFNLANRSVNYDLTANWTVGGILNIPLGSTLRISGYTLSIADKAGLGTFSGSITSNLIVNTPSSGPTNLVFLVAANSLNNLGIASSATTSLLSLLNIYGVLTPQSGTFNTGGLLTLKSTATSTARVAPVAGSITGTVTVERFIPARRAWRIMSAPVGGSQSINSAWQEGATTSSANPNPNPGYGTHITEGSAANGWDHNPLTAMISVKRYASSTDTWNPLANTNSTAVNADAYLLFVRGDRSIALGDNQVPANNTTLRATGPLKTGDQIFPVSAAGFTAIPNPFASPINFATIARTNVQNNFYLWDPKLGGEFGVGGYVLLSYNGSSYDVIPSSVSPESQYIQSGQGFLVHSTGSSGSLTIKESDKSATAAADVFRAGGSGRTGNGTPFADVPLSTTTAGLRINLQSFNKDNTISLLDEVFSSYGNNFSDKIDQLDAQKVPNMEENLAIIRGNSTLMVDRSQALEENDVIQLKLWNTAAKPYVLEFHPVGLNTAVSKAYLIDHYSKTSTPIDLHKVSQTYFNVNADIASANPNRFTVAFKAGSDATADSKSGITTYPNPVSGKIIQLLFKDQPQGTYKVELMNGLGQVIHRTQIQHGGGSSIQRLQLANAPASGVYLLNIANSSVRSSLKVVVNQAR